MDAFGRNVDTKQIRSYNFSSLNPGTRKLKTKFLNCATYRQTYTQNEYDYY